VDVFAVYTGSKQLEPLQVERNPTLFFNFGFLTIEPQNIDLKSWFPFGEELPTVVVGDDEISMIHDMALYRQTRTRLEDVEDRQAKMLEILDRVTKKDV
jgi:CRISPR-associated protein Cmr4